MNHSATYSPEDDKVRISPAYRLDKDDYNRVKAAGYRWAPMQKVFFAVWSPAAEDIALEMCGEIEDEDKSLVERAEERADRFQDYSENRKQDAELAHAAVKQIADNIPLGQPILVGHHSERHARRDAAKIENGMRKAVHAWKTSEYWKQRAAGALHHAKYKERPDVRARRIKTLEADIRRYKSYYTPDPRQKPMMQEKYDWKTMHSTGREVPHVWCVNGSRGGRWVAEEDLPGIEAGYRRTIEHIENRLIYERAMLEDAGGTVADQNGPQVGGGCMCWASHRGGFSWIVKVNKVSVTVYDNWGNTNADGTPTKNFTRVIPFDKLTMIISKTKVEEARAAGLLIEYQDKTGFFLAESPAAVQESPRPTPDTPKAPTDPLEAQIGQLAEVLKTGIQVVSAPQLFVTPNRLAERVIEEAVIEPGMVVLEPSAGTGALIQAARRLHARCSFVAIESNPALAEQLRAGSLGLGTSGTICADFLECLPEVRGYFDRIVMNPPFADGSDIKHIQHAMTFLKPGGLLVAICANGPRQQEKLQPIACRWSELPEGSFKEAGTMVRTALMVYQAPEEETTTSCADPIRHTTEEPVAQAAPEGFRFEFMGGIPVSEAKQPAPPISGGRSWQALKETKAFDSEKLAASPLFERRLF